MLSGTAAFATGTYVQAQRSSSVIELNGKTVANPPKLVYGGTTYVQLYSIQNGLQSVFETRPTWDGNHFNILEPTPIGSNDSVQVAFTRAGDHPELVLESAINNAHSTLDIAIYSITKQDIVDSIITAKKRGVNVRVITDKTEAGNSYQKVALTDLANAGIPIKENSHSGLMHMKVSIIDDKEVATGSYNYSESASTVNDENLVILDNPQIASQYETEFNQMWNNTSEYRDYT